MPVLPFHKYFGPGNELDRGDPVDEDDRIAQEHDLAYETASTAADVVNADESAINAFWHNYDTTGNWHSLIGALGLRIKQQLEKRVGIIYPDISNLARKEHAAHQLANRQREEDSTHPLTSSVISDIGQHENNKRMETEKVDVSQQDKVIDGDTKPRNDVITLYVLKSVGLSGFIVCYFLVRRCKKCL